MIIFGFRLIYDDINQLDFMLYNIQFVTILWQQHTQFDVIHNKLEKLPGRYIRSNFII